MKCNTCGKWAGAHATLPGQSTDHLCTCLPKNEKQGFMSAVEDRDAIIKMQAAELTSLRAAAQQGLDELKYAHKWLGWYDEESEAITSLTAALKGTTP